MMCIAAYTYELVHVAASIAGVGSRPWMEASSTRWAESVQLRVGGKEREKFPQVAGRCLKHLHVPRYRYIMYLGTT